MRRNAIILLLGIVALGSSACSVSNAYVYPTTIQKRYLITTGDISVPHESLGYVQISRSGVRWCGFVTIVDADLQTMFGELLVPEIEKAHADGIINVHFDETQYTLGTKILMVIPPLCPLIPLPTHVQLVGELISLKNHPTATEPEEAPAPADNVSPTATPAKTTPSAARTGAATDG